MKEKTCGHCPHLITRQVDAKTDWYLYGCGAVDRAFMVPHKAVQGEPVIFWRVPLNCPRPSTEVDKSDQQADPNDWVYRQPGLTDTTPDTDDERQTD